MTTPYRSDQKRVMITLSADRYNELKATARAYSLTMTGIINNLIGDYLKAERSSDADQTGAGLASRVERLEKRLATLSAMVTPRRRSRRDNGKQEPPTGGETFGPGSENANAMQSDGAPIMQTAGTDLTTEEPNPAPTMQGATVQAVTQAEADQTTEAPAPTMQAAKPSTANAPAMIAPKEQPPRENRLDDQHARAADVARRACVPLASTLAGGSSARPEPPRHDHAGRAQSLEETKRRAASYALHGARYNRGPFVLNGAGT